jgi:glutamine synthetase
MQLMPDADTANIDPFMDEPTLQYLVQGFHDASFSLPV